MCDEFLFNSAQAALTYAYHYAGQQSPRTPMTRLLQGGAIGTGKGLSGLDGAAQAGMILSRVAKLPQEQQDVLRVRFGDVRSDCPCCGQDAPCDEWLDAVDALSHCVELEGVPRRVRRAAIERAVGRRKWDAAGLSREYGLSERTLRHQCLQLKRRLAKVENQAVATLDAHFVEAGLIPGAG